MTLRQIIKEGRRGHFAMALLRYYEEPTLPNLMDAYMKADDANRAALQKALPAVSLVRVWEAYMTLQFVDPATQGELQKAFKGLALLDQETDDPHAISIREGEVIA